MQLLPVTEIVTLPFCSLIPQRDGEHDEFYKRRTQTSLQEIEKAVHGLYPEYDIGSDSLGLHSVAMYGNVVVLNLLKRIPNLVTIFQQN